MRLFLITGASYPSGGIREKFVAIETWIRVGGFTNDRLIGGLYFESIKVKTFLVFASSAVNKLVRFINATCGFGVGKGKTFLDVLAIQITIIATTTISFKFSKVSNAKLKDSIKLPPRLSQVMWTTTTHDSSQEH